MGLVRDPRHEEHAVPPRTGPPIRVLLGDPHRRVRRGVRDCLADCPGIEVVAEAQDAEEALLQAAELEPDVAVLDVLLPGLGGAETARQLAPRSRVIAVSMLDDGPFVDALIGAGARGYVLKDVCPDELPAAIRAVFAGGTYLSPGLRGGPARIR